MAKRKLPDKKPFEQLTITDNYMFQAVMQDKKRVTPLLEMILGKNIREIKIVETEKTLEAGYSSRGIRMDVYIEDDENTVYDVEMQASRKRHLGLRFRYYQGIIDVDIVSKGEDFNKLRKSYIIFITSYDPYGKGWYFYPFDVSCEWDRSIKMNNASFWYVLNTAGTKDAKGHEAGDEIKEMLSCMNGNKPKSDYARMLDDAVKEIKQNEERRREYMSIYANAADMKELGDYRTYVRQVRGSTVSDDILTAVLKIALTTIQNIRALISAHPDWDDEDVAEEVLNMEDDD